MVDYLGQQLLLISSFKLISIKTVVLEQKKKYQIFYNGTDPSFALCFIKSESNFFVGR